MITFKYLLIISLSMKKKVVKKKVVKTVRKSKPKKSSSITKKTKPSSKKVCETCARVKTGVTNLDPLIQGGLKNQHINLVVGSAGSGKTIFAMQFLMEGLKKGESCVYITFEEKKEKLYDDMKAFGWDFKKYEDTKKLFYLEYNPEQVKSLIEEGGGTIDQIIAKNKIDRIVIDSVTSFSLLYQDELSKKEAGLALFELINKWGCTAVLTSQAVEVEDELHSGSLQFEADSIILLYHFKQKGQRSRAIEILKMRGTCHTNKTMALEIVHKKGLVIHPNKIVHF
jgi:circadian clock protein KaiC